MSITHSANAGGRKRRSSALARLVKERDLHACICCGFPGSEAHHIEWVCDGGDDTPANVVTLCRDCHAQAPPPDEFLEFQRDGGSASWLLSQMSPDQRCAWHLYGWWTHPGLKADRQMDEWRDKSNAALEKSGRALSLFLAPHMTWESSHPVTA